MFNSPKDYFYKGNKLYNIKHLINDFNFMDIEANYDLNGEQKRGKFYIKDLQIK